MSNENDMQVTLEGNELTIKVKLLDSPRPSSTGKSLILFTSGGFKWQGEKGTPDNYAINLTVIKNP